jgi:hypothetical protein
MKEGEQCAFRAAHATLPVHPPCSASNMSQDSIIPSRAEYRLAGLKPEVRFQT